MSVVKPALPVILGSGPLAEAMRAQVAADPDRYRPETWSLNRHAYCPCCKQDVFRCTTRHTGWVSGFATHANVVHASYSSKTQQPDPAGDVFACCCVAPNWGPAHDEKNEPTKKRKGRSCR